jgi:hypothetical protein
MKERWMSGERKKRGKGPWTIFLATGTLLTLLSPVPVFFREPRFTDEQETRTGLVPDFLGEPRFTNEQETQGYISEIYFFENVGILNQCSPTLKNFK